MVEEIPKIQPQEMAADPKPKLSLRQRRWFKPTLITLGVLLVLSLVIVFSVIRTFKAAQSTLDLARQTYTAGKNQNLPEFNSKLEVTKQELIKTHKVYKILSWTRIIPFAGSYYKDGDHSFKAAIAVIEASQILGTTLEPYADVLGFQGQGLFTGGTAEERITKVVETLDKIIPEIDSIALKIDQANKEIIQINPKRYPKTFKGKDVRQNIITAQEFTAAALTAVTDSKPLIEKIPQMLGVEDERKYLVLFQNDAELRATGGFLTAYGILRIDKGKVFQEKSNDIYDLDSKFTKRLKTPDLIEKYLPLVFYWNLRDMNLSPDFAVSMETFYKYYKTVPGEPEVDGIITVDTQVLNDLVSTLGPIEVPGYGKFSSENDPRCDCPQIIYELELMADKPSATLRSDRKGFIAPMLQTILLKAYGSEKNMWPGLFQTVIRNINEKHVLFYMLDEDEQKALEGVNIAGRIKPYDADYFHLNDINFAGAKSNMFVTQIVDQEITIADDGTITKKISATYKNSAPASNCNLEAGELCLNGILRDVLRLYVPKGSKLTEALGFEQDSVETYEDLDKTVFQGFFKLSPLSQAKIIIEYTLPFKLDTQDYKMLIQKQPGTKSPHYTITINQEHQQEFDLIQDMEYVQKL